MDQRTYGGAPALVLLLACGGGGPKREVIAITPPPEPMTRATLVGPLCKPEVCACRDPGAPADGGAGVPPAGVKRFEIRLGPSEHELWLNLDDMVLYKSTARAEDCFYVDLPDGEHHLALRAHRFGGLSAAVRVSEYGAATQSWYDSYAFGCGVPGACTVDELDEYKAGLSRYPRGIHDPCGSVKVRGLSWDTGVSPDQVHPDDLWLGLTLKIFDFTPKEASGDPACAGRF